MFQSVLPLAKCPFITFFSFFPVEDKKKKKKKQKHGSAGEKEASLPINSAVTLHIFSFFFSNKRDAGSTWRGKDSNRVSAWMIKSYITELLYRSGHLNQGCKIITSVENGNQIFRSAKIYHNILVNYEIDF